MRAGALFDIEAEAARLIAARFAFGQLAEEVADLIEEFDVGGGIGAGIAPDGRLVDGDHFVDLFDPFDRLDALPTVCSPPCRWLERRIENIGDQEDLPEPETPVTAIKTPKGNLDIDIFQVVVGGSYDLQRFSSAVCAAFWGWGCSRLPVR